MRFRPTCVIFGLGLERVLGVEMKIEFFYFADCPSHGAALERLRKVLREEGVSAGIEIVKVKTDSQAARLRFIGSPTIRIDGRDIDPGGLEGQAPALTCRVYHHEDGRFSPLPSEQMIHAALRRGDGP